jgi:hypothetical protein
MSVENAIIKHSLLLAQAGKVALNISHPNEFELYMCALELTDENYKTIQYFVFPVMPTTIDETQTFLTNIKKTLGGIVVLSSPTFNPIDVTLAGTFGRKFKVLLGESYTDFVSSFTIGGSVVTAGSIGKGAVQTFDSRVKTGYGCLKIMEEMIGSTNVVDKRGSRRLILHNPALGNSYLVKPQSLKLSQSQDTNMIWSYSLSLKAIAPLNHIFSSEELKSQRIALTATGYVQKGVDNVIGALTEKISAL